MPFQKHVGQLSLSPLCHWERTALNHIPVIVILIRRPEKKGGAKKKDVWCACTHTLSHSGRAYLQYEREARQSGAVTGE